MSSRSQVDKEALASVLDHIHSTASRSETLTTFSEFASPPRLPVSGDGKSLAGDLVHGGLSGLYNKFRASVGVARDAVVRPTSAHSHDNAEEAPSSNTKATSGQTSAKSSASTLVSSPVVVSTSSSRLQSPFAAYPPDNHLASPRSIDSSAISLIAKDPVSVPRASVSARTRTVNETIMHHGKSSSIDVERVNKAAQDGPLAEFSLKSPRPDISGSGTSSIAHTPRSAPSTNDKIPDLQGPGTVKQPVVQQTSRAANITADHMHNNTDDSSQPVDQHEVLEDDDDQPIGPEFSETTPVTQQSLSTAAVSTSAGSTLAKQAAKGMPDEFETTSLRPLLRVSQSHLPGYRPSRNDSSDGELSSVATVAPARHATFELPERDRDMTERISGTPPQITHAQRRRRLLGKEFWMRDENAKDCFYCGSTFSTFRRKHHCRTYSTTPLAEP